MRPARALAVVVCLALAGSATFETVVVRPGDTLSSLATAHHTTVIALAAVNHLTDPDLIFAGVVLRLPSPALAAPTTWTVEDLEAAVAGATLPTWHSLPVELQLRPDRLRLRPLFQWWAAVYHVPADLLEALDWWESGWQNDLVSASGAIGIGQLLPDTVAFVSGVLLHRRLDPHRPADNIRMSARFLRYLLDRTRGSPARAIAAYYQGLASVRRGRILAATRQYVIGILALRAMFA